MKLITAIIQPDVLEDVEIALAQAGASGMTVSEVSGYGRQRGHTEVYRGAEYTIDFIAKVRIDILAAEAEVEGIISIICESARDVYKRQGSDGGREARPASLVT